MNREEKKSLRLAHRPLFQSCEGGICAPPSPCTDVHTKASVSAAAAAPQLTSRRCQMGTKREKQRDDLLVRGPEHGCIVSASKPGPSPSGGASLTCPPAAGGHLRSESEWRRRPAASAEAPLPVLEQESRTTATEVVSGAEVAGMCIRNLRGNASGSGSACVKKNGAGTRPLSLFPSNYPIWPFRAPGAARLEFPLGRNKRCRC